MVDLELKLRRSSFQLEIACRLTAPWTVAFGPSGAGKSTLLRLLAGLDTPHIGRIAIHGEYVCDTETGLNLRPGLRQVGMVTQQPALFPHLSVAENVAYGLATLHRGERAQRASAMLELLEATHLATRLPSALSGGEAQRVAVARALAPLPRLLLLDEPFSALDGAARDGLLSRLQSWLLDRNIQTIVVTHDAADALATDAEVVLIQEGRLAAQGEAKTVLADERNRLLARLELE